MEWEVCVCVCSGGRGGCFGCEIHPSETCALRHSWHSDLWDAWDASVFSPYVGGCYVGSPPPTPAGPG